MNHWKSVRWLLVVVVVGSLCALPSLAAKGGKAQVINYHMTPTAADVDARGKVQYKAMAGKERFHLTVHDLDLGTYSFDVDGTSVALFDVIQGDEGTQGKLRLKAKKGDLLFDPRGAELAVSREGIIYLTALFPVSAKLASTSVEIEVDLLSTGVIAEAVGEAEFETRLGRAEFEVEIGGVPPGTYELFVGGVLKGVLTVGVEGEAELEFTTHVEDVDEDGIPDEDLLLDFDPRGLSIQVYQSGVVVLEAVFPLEPVAGDNGDEDDDDSGEDEDDD